MFHARNYIYVIAFALFLIFPCACSESPNDPEKGEDGNGGHDIQIIYPLIDEHPSFSPDGKTIAYYHSGITNVNPDEGYATIDPDQRGIWFINTDGTSPRLFIHNGNMPDFSPDGQTLTFCMGYQIFTIRINGTELSKLSENGQNIFPAWSSDGQRIAYESDRSGRFRLWIMNRDGKEKTNFDIIGNHPAWSPDNLYIVYDYKTIWTLHIREQITEPVIDLHDVDSRYPAYSPDGTKIAFAYKRTRPTESPCYPQIYIMNTDGRELKQLTSGGGTQPCWSQDGTLIAYVCDRPHEYSSEHGTIWVMDADGDNKRQITTSPIPAIVEHQEP